MKNEFDWQIDIEEEEWGEPEKPPPARRQINPVWFMVVSTILVVGVLGGWFAGRRQVERSEADLSQSAQAVLDLERDAFLKGDGDLYFSVMADDPVWQAAQLRSENLAPVRAGYTVTRAQAQDDFIWANLSWEENGRSHQRIAFFQRQNGRLQHVPTDPNYWGKTMHLSQEWGKLTYSEIDEPFAADIAATAKKLMADTCAVQCIPDRLPVTLILTTDFSRTAAANTIHLPSPRLLTLDANGRPDGRYQEHLRQAITDYLTPATIRFALPPFAVSDEHLLNYNQAAAAFMAANPHITIELVQLETLPDDLSELTQFDGAAVTPTADMITAGLVLDLTDFAHSDADFHPNDFYELAWQGAVWRDRLWFVPQMADLRLLYYDKAAYQLAQRPEPSWQWNWADMETDMAAMIAAQPPGSVMNWGFLDVGRDSLFAYAYNESKRCRQDNCPTTLQPQQVHAALNWYQQMIQQNRMPDVSTLTPYQREEFLLSKQSARRHAAIWVDEPVLYENHLLLDAIGVAPFPGLNLFDGTTPLWVDGSFISATSTRPAAVWQWLVFLSDVPPLTGFRRIPARPSIAAQTGFWFTLPRQLADPMRAAYNNARPVTIGDQLYFTPEQLTAVASGELSPALAAQTPPIIQWFNIK